MTKILVTDAALAQQLAANLSGLANDVEWRVCESSDEQEIAREIADATVYIGGAFTPTIAGAAKQLEFIQVPGAGLDEINFDVLPPHVTLANTFNHERAIAEYIIMTMLALSRRLIQADAGLRKGLWSAARGDNEKSRPFHTLEGQTVGMVGFGHIGKQVAVLAKAFGMKTIAIKRAPAPSLAREWGLEFLGGEDDLEQILTRSDFLVLAAPLTSATQHVIGARELAMLQASAYLINVARALIIQEEALYQVLHEHRIAGAALDVWYEYPKGNTPTLPAHLPFHLLDNVILTPHYSGATEETRIGRLADMTFNLQSWFEHKPLRNVVSSRATNSQ